MMQWQKRTAVCSARWIGGELSHSEQGKSRRFKERLRHKDSRPNLREPPPGKRETGNTKAKQGGGLRRLRN